jgi:uncharacterized membrane protein YfcA
MFDSASRQQSAPGRLARRDAFSRPLIIIADTALRMAEYLPFVDQANPWLSALLAAAAVVIVGIAKSGFGGGVGIVAVPLMIFAFDDPAEALGTLLPLLIAADALSVWHHWGTWDRRNLLLIAPGTVLGLLLGTAALWYVLTLADGSALQDQSQRWMKLAIGVICVLYVAADLLKTRYAPHRHVSAGWSGATLVGIGAGVTSTFAHAAGPVTAVYWLSQQLPKQRFIGTAVTYYFVLNTVKLLPYAALGLIDGRTLICGLWLLPLAPLGTALGAKLNHRMSESLFRGIIMLIVFVSGVQFILSQVT